MTYASSRTLSIREPGLIKVCLPHHSLWLNKSDTLTKSLTLSLLFNHGCCSQHLWTLLFVENGPKNPFIEHTHNSNLNRIYKLQNVSVFNCLDCIHDTLNATNQQTWSANVLVRNVNSSLWRIKDWKDRRDVVQIRSIRLVSWLLCWVLIDSFKISAGREASWEISKYLIKDKHTDTHIATDPLITPSRSLADSISLYQWNCNLTTIRQSHGCVSHSSLSCTDVRRGINAVLHLIGDGGSSSDNQIFDRASRCHRIIRLAAKQVENAGFYTT